MKGEVLSRSEVSALIHAATHHDDGRARGVTGVRNAAIVSVLYRSGLRIGEAVALCLVDVNQARAELRVRRGKGNKSRVVPIDAGCVVVLQRWLELRAELGAKRIDPVFCTLQCGPLATRYVRAMLPRLARRANLDRRVHAHAFRHTFSAELCREGKPAPQIQRLLGHGSLQVTQDYLASLVVPVELEAAIRSRPPWRDDDEL